MTTVKITQQLIHADMFAAEVSNILNRNISQEEKNKLVNEVNLKYGLPELPDNTVEILR